jgi:hypothetical protein
MHIRLERDVFGSIELAVSVSVNFWSRETVVFPFPFPTTIWYAAGAKHIGNHAAQDL